MESSPTSDIGALIIATKGRSALERQLAQGRVPKQLTVQYMEHSFGEGLSSN